MKKYHRIIATLLATHMPVLPLVSLQAAPPTITHQPVSATTAGQARDVMAKVSGAGVAGATLRVTRGADDRPVEFPMRPIGSEGAYHALLPASLLQPQAGLRYSIRAVNQAGEASSTAWTPIQVAEAGTHFVATETGIMESVTPDKGSDVTPPPTEDSGRPGWFYPAVIGGGVLLVGGAIALASGGGGGDDNGGGGPAVDNDTFISQTVTLQSRDQAQNLPLEGSIDISGALNGRTVTGVEVTLSVTAVDAKAEQAEVIYENTPIIITGAVNSTFTAKARRNGSSPRVTVRVTGSELNDTGTQSFVVTSTAVFSLRR